MRQEEGGRVFARFAVVFAFVLFAGCAHQKSAATSNPEQQINPKIFLSGTNATPGSVHAVKIYVVQRGDNVGRIAHSFAITPKELRRLNPEMDPIRISVGQQLRVAEERIEAQWKR